MRDGRSFEALNDVGHRLTISEFAAEYAASDVSQTDKILMTLYDEEKPSLVAEPKRARDEFVRMGCNGPFCSLQMGMTFINNDEHCIPLVSVIL